MLLFVLYAQIIASGQNTVNKMQNQRFHFILAYKKSQFNLFVTHKINRTDVKDYLLKKRYHKYFCEFPVTSTLTQKSLASISL